MPIYIPYRVSPLVRLSARTLTRALNHETMSGVCVFESVCIFNMHICSFALCGRQLHFLREWQSTDHSTIITHIDSYERRWTDCLSLVRVPAWAHARAK